MNKKELLKDIAEKEYEFFIRINMQNKECKREKPFKATRIARFYPLSIETLSSYLKDLKQFALKGRNPMLDKYLCIERKEEIKNETIDQIASIENDWMKELKERYPVTFRNKTEEFTRYLRCELSTFSNETLQKYHKDVVKMKDSNINMAEVSYTYLFKLIGYKNLEEVEKAHTYHQ